MNFMKKAGLGISAFMLTAMLYALVSIVTFLLTLGNANYIKNTLVVTDFYKNIVGSTISLTVSQSPTNSESQNSVNDLKILTPILQQTISPQVIQSTVEPLIDGFDNWLQGKSDQPQFNINTQTIHANMISQISNYLSTQTDKLPVCTNASQLQLPFNPLTAACRPVTPINPDDFTNAASNFVDSMPIYNGSPITLEVIDPQGSMANNALLQKVPMFYQWLKVAQFICAILIIVFAILVIWLKPRKNMALKTVGRTFIVAAAFLLVTGLLFLFYFGNRGITIINSSSAGQQDFMETIVNPLSQHFTNTLGNYYLYFAAIYAVIGIILFFIGKKYQPAKTNIEPKNENITVKPYKAVKSFRDPSSDKTVVNNPIGSSTDVTPQPKTTDKLN